MAMAIDQHQPALSGSSSRGKTGWGGDNVNPDFARRSYDPMSESAFVFRSASGTPSWSSSLAADAGITGELVIARSRRSDERRVGNECVSTCRSWGDPNN